MPELAAEIIDSQWSISYVSEFLQDLLTNQVNSLYSDQTVELIRLIMGATEMGQAFREQLLEVQQQFLHIIKEVRGKGLLNAIELNNKVLAPVSAYDICLKMKERGILSKPTHDTIIRLAPPLCVSLKELLEASRVMRDVF